MCGIPPIKSFRWRYLSHRPHNSPKFSAVLLIFSSFFVLRLCASFVWLACALFLFLFNRTLSLSCYLIFCGVRACSRIPNSLCTIFTPNFTAIYPWIREKGHFSDVSVFSMLNAVAFFQHFRHSFLMFVFLFLMPHTHSYICEKHKRIRQEYFENWRWRKKI